MPPKRKTAKATVSRAKRPRTATPSPETPQDDVHGLPPESDHDADAEGEEEGGDLDGNVNADDGPANPDADVGPEPAPEPAKRGRARARKTRGGGPSPTRSSPRKTALERQSAPEPETKEKPQRGRRPGRPRGRVKSDGGRAERPTADAQEEHGVPDDAKGEADEQGPQSHQEHQQQPSQPSPPPSPEHIHPTPQQSVPAPAPPPPTSFVYTHYSSYPSHNPSYSYAYPPPGPGPEHPRPYLSLRPETAPPPAPPPLFTTPTPQTSFATTFSYDNAPQGNPFPPFGAVYSVPSNDEEDEGTTAQAQGQVRKRPPAKAGGRAGRGDHVACHFCRGRKLKCDGRRPTCGHCALRSLACAYDETIRRRGPGKKEKNVKRSSRASAANMAANAQHPPPPLTAPPPPPEPNTDPNALPPAPPPPPPQPKRRRRPQATHLPLAPHPHAHTGVLRFDHADMAPATTGTAKPASAAYGVESNERLGYYYAPGPDGGYAIPAYPPYPHEGPDGTEDNNAYDEDQGHAVPHHPPPHPPPPGGYAQGQYAQWPAEPPGGHPHGM